MAKYTLRELNVHDFQGAIFDTDGDLLAPVSIYSDGEGDRLSAQTLKCSIEFQKKHPSQLATYVGPAGVGQYSLRRNVSVGALSRFDVHFRQPTDLEMNLDFQDFGEQVMGPAVEETQEEEREKWEHNATFEFLDKYYYFTGPPRIVKSTFITRVFPGELPKDISDFVGEVDGLSEKGDQIVHQCYQFFHAEGGRVVYLPLAKSEDYDSGNVQLYGDIEMDGRNLTWFPRGDRTSPVDFTQAYV